MFSDFTAIVQASPHCARIFQKGQGAADAAYLGQDHMSPFHIVEVLNHSSSELYNSNDAGERLSPSTYNTPCSYTKLQEWFVPVKEFSLAISLSDEVRLKGSNRTEAHTIPPKGKNGANRIPSLIYVAPGESEFKNDRVIRIS